MNPTKSPVTTTTTSFSIRQAAHQLNVSEMYLRKMIKLGKISTTKAQVTENVWRHEISQATLDAFKAHTGQRSSRDDGRNKFVVYMTAAEETQVRELLKGAKLASVESLLGRANPSKTAKADADEA